MYVLLSYTYTDAYMHLHEASLALEITYKAYARNVIRNNWNRMQKYITD
jgi:hypothetical protein